MMKLANTPELAAVVDVIWAAPSAQRYAWNNSDDYGNPVDGYAATIDGSPELLGYPEPYTHLVEKHYVTGGYEIVWEGPAGAGKFPESNGDPFGPINQQRNDVDSIWNEITQTL